MLEKFQPIKIAKRFYWLNAFLTKSKSVLTENVLNQLKIIENIKIGGFNRNTIQIRIKINEVKILRIFQSSKIICLLSNRSVLTLLAWIYFSYFEIFAIYFEILNTQF